MNFISCCKKFLQFKIKLTKWCLCLDGICSFKWWSNAIVINSHNSEQIFLSFCKPLYSKSGLLTETGHYNPVSQANISPFHNIVSNTKTAIILRWFPVQCACVFGYVRHIKWSDRRTRKTCIFKSYNVNNDKSFQN